MNPGATSKEAIMQVCRRIAAQEGLSALNMRAVARECGVALGTLYNYYADKDALLIATVESIWREIFHMDGNGLIERPFPERIAHLFDCIQRGADRYPGFLGAHSVVIAGARRAEARQAMEACFAHMRAGLLAGLDADPAVNPAAFSDAFTPEGLVDFALDHLLLLLMKGEGDCAFLTEMLRRALR
ncbi:MAG: TetR/AcrR family transcriptional regulator [Candidatus Ventricola sp.]